MTEQAISTILAVAGVREDDLTPRNKRILASVRRDAATAAELTERWRGKTLAGSVVRRVIVGNPWRTPQARLTNGRIVPLPVDVCWACGGPMQVVGTEIRAFVVTEIRRCVDVQCPTWTESPAQ